MAFPRNHLHGNEQLVLDRQPHWWFLAPRGAILVVSSIFGIWVLARSSDWSDGMQTTMRIVAGLLVVASLGAFLVRLLGWKTTHFVVTTDRCIYRSGVLKKSGIEIPLERINTVLFSQTLFERMLNAGDISIESAGESSRQNFSDISNPIVVQNTIYQQIEENENRKYDRIGMEAREAAAASAGAQTPNRSDTPPTQVISVADQLHKLADLRDRGVLTEEQFEAQKRAILGE